MGGRKLGPVEGQQRVGARMEREGSEPQASGASAGDSSSVSTGPVARRRPGSALHEGPPAVRG